jgi:predicted nucleic acid-binding protein
MTTIRTNLNAVVIDASVAVKWVAEESLTEQAISLLAGPALCAPAHWLAEAGNAVWSKFYRGQWSAEIAQARGAALHRAPVEPVPLLDLSKRALELAIAMEITVYDALYVALAEVRGIPLVSGDGKLMRRMANDSALAPLAQPLADLPLP